LRFDNLPPDLLTQVEIYDMAAKQYLDWEKRLIGFAFLQAGGGHYWDNKALPGASHEDNDLRKDPFVEGRAGIGLDQALSEIYLLDANLDYRFRTFDNSVIRNDSDRRWVGEVSRTLGESNLALGVRGRVSNRGNGYRNDYGVFGSWRYRLRQVAEAEGALPEASPAAALVPAATTLHNSPPKKRTWLTTFIQSRTASSPPMAP
jgi:hypothetical protein